MVIFFKGFNCLMLLVSSILTSLTVADELFLYLTQESGVYKLYYTSDLQNWQSYDVPDDIKRIEDVEFNYAKEQFFFSSSQLLQKGLWRANMTLEDYTFSHQLRDDSSPLKLLIYPEYDLALFYDKGYSLVIEITLETEGDDLRIKSLFQAADRLNGNFFLDRKTNQIYAQPDDGRPILFVTPLNGSLLTSVPFIPAAGSNVSVTGYDSEAAMVYYCGNGYLNGMLESSVTYPATIRLPCNPMTVDNGMVYFTNTETGFIQKMSFGPSGVVVHNDKFLRLPFSVSPTTKIISFKHYTYNPNNVNRFCEIVDCDQICLPTNSGPGASCQCMDYYTIAKNDTGLQTADSPCDKDTLARPGVFYAIYNVSFAQDTTIFYRLEGDPAIWTRRPQREQLFTISSDIAGVAFDWNHQRMFAVALRFREIMSTSLNGSFVTAGHYSGVSPSVKSVAYDWVGNNLVWFDPVFRWLRIVPLWNSPNFIETHYKTCLVSANLAGYDLRLDAIAGYLFFLEFDDTSATVSLYRTLMDGSEPTKLYLFPDYVFSDSLDDNNPEIPLPGAINIDFFHKHIWVFFTSNVYVLTYNGELVYSVQNNIPDHTIYNSRVSSLSLYNTSYALVVIKRVDTDVSTLFAFAIIRNADGSCCNTLVNSYSKTIYGEYRALTNFEEQPKVPESLNCAALNCLYMCANVRGVATCICPDDYVWDSTRKHCQPSLTDQLSTPSIVFTALDKVCYRNLIDQTSYAGRSSFASHDNCSSTGFAAGPLNSPRSVKVDPLTFNAYVLQVTTNPRTTFKVNLAQAPRASYLYNLLTPLGQLASIVSGNLTASDVFYSSVMSNFSGTASLAFDWLGRNLYIADQANGRLLVVRDDFTDPLVLVFNTNFTSLAVDSMRRKIYWSVGVGSTSVIVQRDLDAANSYSECVVAKFDGAVVKMDISHYNQTLLFLTQPSNQIGRILLRRLPPFVSHCPTTVPPIQYNSLARDNVRHFSVYRAMIFFTCQSSGSDCDQTIFSSTNLGQTIDANVTVFQQGITAAISSTAAFDPHLLTLAFNKSSFAARDRCASMARGECGQFCLSSWPSTGNSTNINCYCSDGMVLMRDGRQCTARSINIASDGIIFTPDDYRHQIFALPLSALSNQLTNVNTLTTFAVRQKARPYAVAYDYIADHLYYSDFDHGGIFRLSPNKQMSSSLNNMDAVNEHFIEQSPDSRVYGLFVDPVSRLLFFTVRDNCTLFAVDLETKQIALIKKFSGNIFGLTMDRRADKIHLYVALRNNSRVVQTSTVSNDGGQSRTVVVYRQDPFTWSSIVRVSPDGSNYEVITNFTALGDDVQRVPWIYDMVLDYSTNRLYFSTGQNRSIMYQNLEDLSTLPQTLFVSANNNSFIYGIQLYDDFVIATDWGSGGLHVFNKNSGQKLNVLIPQYLIGANGLAVYSASQESAFQSVNAACSGARRYCSHVCVPLANNQRKCICPNGAETIDGINCPGVATCPKPPSSLGMFDSKCTFRKESLSCTLTCSSDNLALDPVVRGDNFSISCMAGPGGRAQWCTDLSNICRSTNDSGIDTEAVNKCTQQAAVAMAAVVADDDDDGSSLHPGVIAGIVIGTFVVVAALSLAGFFAWRRYQPVIAQHLHFPFFSSSSTGGLPHFDEISVPESFRYRNLQEADIQNASA